MWPNMPTLIILYSWLHIYLLFISFLPDIGHVPLYISFLLIRITLIYFSVINVINLCVIPLALTSYYPPVYFFSVYFCIHISYYHFTIISLSRSSYHSSWMSSYFSSVSVCILNIVIGTSSIGVEYVIMNYIFDCIKLLVSRITMIRSV